MPDHEELEQITERNLAEFPDDDAWERLKAEVMSQRDKEDDDGEDC